MSSPPLSSASGAAGTDLPGPRTPVSELAAEPTPGGADAAEFDLDVVMFESDAGLAELMRLTDDGCGATCQSACGTTCP